MNPSPLNSPLGAAWAAHGDHPAHLYGSILIADDDGINRFMLSGYVEAEGHTVTTAENGQQALDLLRTGLFDLVLLDLLMPELDGYGVLAAMKADPTLRDIPVIMISSVDELDSVARGIELGAADYLPKPFNEILLHARINACLETKRLRDQEQSNLLAVQAERARSDALLLNILPAPVAERLKAGPGTLADSFPDATVLFADIVGFSRLAAQVTPEALLDYLNEIFSAFDHLVDRYGLEKIKTIGDSYMVVGGVPLPRPDHAEAVAELALAMQAEIGRFCHPDGTPSSLRIGIHSGPVIAGVIGKRKFSYDLWGETVNLASRMESHGLPGQIQVTAETYQRLRATHTFTARGPLAVKDLGEMPAYLLTGRQ
jgi:class 3 adenylate cyclase/CheY-like chemotaxis protein